MTTNKKQLEPSLLGFDLKNINTQLIEAKNIGIKYIHYDVMDNTYGKAFDIEYLDKLINLDFNVNVHIMFQNPLNQIKKYFNYQVNAITFQYEPIVKNNLSYNVFDCINEIKKHSILAGIAIDPYSKPSDYEQYLKECEIVTIMSVVPGKGGQSFIEESLNNLIFVYNYKIQNNLNYLIQVDGGLNIDNFDKVIKYADFIISGSGYVKLDLNQKKHFFSLINNSF